MALRQQPARHIPPEAPLGACPNTLSSTDFPDRLMTCRPWLCFAALSGALALIGIDMTVLNVALPHLSMQLGASTSEKLWMVNAYSLLMAGLLPGFGALSDRIGHRKMLCSGLFVFCIASLIAAFSFTPSMLIAARGFLGIGAAAILPAALSVVRTVFTKKEQQATAIGICGAIWSGAAAIGPVIGGLLLENFWWGAVFLINVPLILISITLSLRWIPRFPSNPCRPWDLVASVLLTAGLIALLFALKSAFKPNADWPMFIGSATVGAAIIVLLLKRARSTAAPLINFNMFRAPLVSLGAFVAFVMGFAFAALQYALSQELQLIRGLSPSLTGVQILPIAGASVVASFLIGPMMSRLGMERLLAISLGLATLGASLFTYVGFRSGALAELTTLSMLGLGIGAVMSIASTAILSCASQDRAGAAASLEAISYELGGTLGIAVAGSAMARIYDRVLMLPPSITLPVNARDGMDQTLIAVAKLKPDEQIAVLSAAQSAFSASIYSVLHGATLMVLVLFVAVGLILFFCPRMRAFFRADDLSSDRPVPAQDEGESRHPKRSAGTRRSGQYISACRGFGDRS